VANKQDDTGAVKIIEALEILKKSLLGLGLNRVNISINSHGHTREESADTARAIVATGFGRDVIPAGEPVRGLASGSWFAWNTVRRGCDVINLFYKVEGDDQPVNYYPTDKEVS
jgi:hypothetical protein